MAGLVLEVKNIQDYAAQIKKLNEFLGDIQDITDKVADAVSKIESSVAATTLGLNVKFDLSKLKSNAGDIAEKVGQQITTAVADINWTPAAKRIATDFKTALESEIKRGNIGGSISDTVTAQVISSMKTRDLGQSFMNQVWFLNLDKNKDKPLDATKVPKITDALKAANPEKDLAEIGRQINAGLALGLITHRGLTLEAAQQLAHDLIMRVQTELDIHSPSMKFMEIAKFAVMGFTEGLDQNDPVNAQATKMAQEALNAIEKTLQTGSPSIGVKNIVQNTLKQTVNTGVPLDTNLIKKVVADFMSLSKTVGGADLTPLLVFADKMGVVLEKFSLLSKKGLPDFSRLASSLKIMLDNIKRILEHPDINIGALSSKFETGMTQFFKGVEALQRGVSGMTFDESANAKFQQLASGLRSFELAIRKLSEAQPGGSIIQFDIIAFVDFLDKLKKYVMPRLKDTADMDIGALNHLKLFVKTFGGMVSDFAVLNIAAPAGIDNLGPVVANILKSVTDMVAKVKVNPEVVKQFKEIGLFFKAITDIFKTIVVSGIESIDNEIPAFNPGVFAGLNNFIMNITAGLKTLDFLDYTTAQSFNAEKATESLSGIAKALDGVANLFTVVDRLQKSMAVVQNASAMSPSGGKTAAFGAGAAALGLSGGAGLAGSAVASIPLLSSMGLGGLFTALATVTAVTGMFALPAFAVGGFAAGYIAKKGNEYMALSNSLFGLTPAMRNIAKALRILQGVDMQGMDKIGTLLGSLSTFLEVLPKFTNKMVSAQTSVIPLPNNFFFNIIKRYYGLSDALFGFVPLMKTVSKGLRELESIRGFENINAAMNAMSKIPDFLTQIGELRGRIKATEVANAGSGVLGETLTTEGSTISKFIYDARSMFQTVGLAAAGLAVAGPPGMIGGLAVSKLVNVISSKIKEYYSLSGLLGGLTPAFKQVAKALNVLSTIKNPDNVKPLLDAFAQGVKSIGDFIVLEEANHFSKKSGFMGWFGEQASMLQPLVPVFKIVAQALGQLSGIKMPGNITESIASFTNMITAISALTSSSIPMQDLGKSGWLNFQVAEKIKILPVIFKIFAEALTPLASIPNSTGLEGVTKAFLDITNVMKALHDIPAIRTDRAKELKTSFGILAESLTQFVSKLGNIEGSDKASIALRRISLALKDLNSIANVGEIAADLEKNMPRVGKAIADGLGKGINTEDIAQQGVDIAETITEATAETLGVHSPSTVFKKLGEYTVAGFILGLNSMKSHVVDWAKQAVSYIYNALSSLPSKITGLFRDVGQSLRNAGQQLFTTGLTTATTGGIAGYIQSQRVAMVAEFDQTLKMIQVFGNTTAQELTGIETQVLKFSADTIFDPQQSATAFLDLQKAGLDVAKSQAALSNVGNLAASSQLSLEESTRGVLAASQLFNISMDDSAHIADVFAQAANLSTASASELIQGLSNVGPIAKQFGLSFEETTAILAMFNNNGIRGAEAGTQLKSMLTNMTRPTETVKAAFAALDVSLSDTQGNFKSMDTILGELRHSLYDTKKVSVQVTKGLTEDQAGLADAASKQLTKASTKVMLLENGLISLSEKQKAALYDQKARAEQVLASLPNGKEVLSSYTAEIKRSQAQNFEALQSLAGTFGQSGLAVLLGQDEEGIANFVDEMGKLPTAAETSASMMDTFKGALDSLKGSIDTLIIKAIRPLMNAVLKPLVQVLVKVVNAFANLPPTILAIVTGAVFLTTALTTLVGVGMVLLGAVLIPLGFMFTSVGAILTGVVAVLWNPLGLIAGFVALSSGVVIVTGALAVLATIVAGFTGLAALYISEMLKNDAVIDSFTRLQTAIESVFGAINPLIASFMTFAGIFTGDLKTDTETSFQPLVTIIDGLTTKLEKLNNFLRDTSSLMNILGEVKQLSDGTYRSSTESAQTRAETATAARETYERNQSAQQRLIGAAGGTPTDLTVTMVSDSVTVAVGDTLWDIAQKNGTTVKDLIALNNLDTTTINPGMELRTSNRTQTTSDDKEYLALLEEEKKANEDLNRIRANERTRQQLFADNDATYTNERVRHMTTLQTKIEEFGQTETGKKVGGFLGIDLNDMQGIIKLVGRLESLFSTLNTQVTNFKNTVISFFSGTASFDTLLTSIARPLGTLSYMFEDLTGIKIGDKLQDLLSWGTGDEIEAEIKKQLLKLGATVVKGLVEFALTTLYPALRNLGTEIIKLFLESLGVDTNGPIFQTIGKIINSISLQLKTFSAQLSEFANSEGGQAMIKFLKMMAIAFGGGILLGGVAILGSLYFAFTLLLNIIPPILKALGGFLLLIEGIATLDSDKIGQGLSDMFTGVLEILASLPKTIIKVMSSIAKAFGADAFAKQLENVGTTVMQLGVIILYGLSRAATAARGIGKSIIEGLLWFFKNPELAFQYLKAGIQAIIDYVKDLLGIASPAKVFIDIGKEIMHGLLFGIGSLIGKIPGLFASAFNTVLSTLGSLAGSLASVAGSGLNIAGGLLGSLFGDPVGFITEYGTKLTNALNELPALIGLPSFSDMGKQILDSIFSFVGIEDENEQNAIMLQAVQVKDAIVDKLKLAFTQLTSGDFSGAWDSLMDAVRIALDTLSNIDEKLGLSEKLKAVIMSAFDTVTTFLSPENLQEKGSALLSALGTALGGLFSSGAEQATTLGSAIIDFIAGGISSAISSSFTLLQAGMDLATGFMNGIVSGLGDLVSWVGTNIIDPIIKAITDAASLIGKALDDIIPNEVSFSLGNATIPGFDSGIPGLGWDAKTVALPDVSLDIPDNPFSSVLGLAKGGPFKAGMPYEFLEQRKNVPFEIANIGNKSYFMANQAGFMQSPQGDGKYGTSNSNVYQNYEGDTHIQINGTGLDEVQLQKAIANGLRDARQQNPINMRLQRQGL